MRLILIIIVWVYLLLLGSGLKMMCEWRGRFRRKARIGMKFSFSFLNDDLNDLLDVIFSYVCVYQWTTCAVVVKWCRLTLADTHILDPSSCSNN